jgi:hypothetical protein
MEWRNNGTDPFQEYLKPFAGLVGDRRTWRARRETMQGIMANGRRIGERSQGKHGAQRVERMAKGKSPGRLEREAEERRARVRQVGVEQLQEMPSLLQVRNQNKTLVPGSRTLNGRTVTPKRRRLLSSEGLEKRKNAAS